MPGREAPKRNPQGRRRRAADHASIQRRRNRKEPDPKSWVYNSNLRPPGRYGRKRAAGTGPKGLVPALFY